MFFDLEKKESVDGRKYLPTSYLFKDLFSGYIKNFPLFVGM